MRIRLLFFTLCLLCSLAMRAEQSVSDSLIQSLPELRMDSTKVLVFNKIALSLTRQDPETANRYAREGLNLARELRYERGIAHILNTLGVIYRYRADYDSAYAYHFQALGMLEKLGDRTGAGEASQNLGNVFYFKANYEKALYYYLNALRIFESDQVLPGIAQVSNNMGSIYRIQNDYANALLSYQKAAAVFVSTDNQDALARTFNNMGSLFLDVVERKTSRDSEGAYSSDTVRLALQYFRKALDIWEMKDDKNGVARAYTNIGISYSWLKDYDRALDYLLRSRKIREALSDKHGLASSYLFIGDMYLKKADYENAEISCKKGLEISKEIGSKYQQQEAYETLASIFRAKNDYREAFDYFEQFTHLKDSLMNSERNKAMAEMQTRFESENKEKEITYLKEVNEANRQNSQNRSLFLLIGMAMIALLLAQTYRMALVRKKANERLEIKVKARTAALEVAIAELKRTNHELDTFLYKTSHDLRGPVATLAGLCNLTLAERITPDVRNYLRMKQKVLDNMQNLLEEVVKVGGVRTHPVRPELFDLRPKVQKVISDLAVKAEDREIIFSVNIPEFVGIETDPELFDSVLSVLLKNAMQHGQPADPDAEHMITIDWEYSQETAKLRIKDSGPGVNKEIMDRLFDMFCKGVSRHGNFGLGLYQASIAVEKLQGEVILESNGDTGATFTILFPAQVVRNKSATVIPIYQSNQTTISRKRLTQG